MRHLPIDSQLFIENRAKLANELKPKSVAFINANDVLPTNADGTMIMHASADLYYLSGIEQEESILMIAPDANKEEHREVLFLRQPNPYLKTWEGEKLSIEKAQETSGIKEIKWLSDFPTLMRLLMCESDNVYLNSNEHPRAVVEVETREARFVTDIMRQFPIHRYERLAPLMHKLRQSKSAQEIELIKHACSITRKGFLRILDKVKPEMHEFEVEAEYAHEFIRNRCKFAYSPIVASGEDSCILHYINNNKKCKDGDLLLMDVGAAYGNYNSDMTRTIPINGKFTNRQREVYDAVLRVMKTMIAAATVGKKVLDWQDEAAVLMNKECLELGLISQADIDAETPAERACKKYFMHGLGHSIGIDVHDVVPPAATFEEGWVVTVEPGIYIPDEEIGVRLENDVLVTKNGPVDLMADIPVEADEIEKLMAS